MHFRSLHHTLISLQVFIIASVAAAAILSPSISLLPNDQAVSHFDDNARIIQKEHVANIRTSLNGSDTISQSIHNKTFSPPSEILNNTDEMIRYKVTDSDTTLDFHSFGASIPTNVLLQTITAALAVTSRYAISGSALKPIHLGWFRYHQPFVEGPVVEFAIGDFREVGRSITYLILCDVLRGIADFMMVPGNGCREARFEVEVEGLGYAGSGRVEYSTPGVASA